MSNWKKAMICIFVCVEIYFIFAFAFKYKSTLYLTVYGDELIENVFDEIYYSQMHPAFFKYTDTDLLNLRGVIWPDDPFPWGDSQVIPFRTRDSSDTLYTVELYNNSKSWDILFVIKEVRDDYMISYYYDYKIEKKVLTYHFDVFSYSHSGKRVYRSNDIDAFFEETGLSYDYIRKHQQLELDKFLEIWLEKNEGLSRFSSDDLGDFTVEWRNPRF